MSIPPPKSVQNLKHNIQIYEHSLPASASVLKVLEFYLPFSVPILRRLQHPAGLPASALLLATFPPQDLDVNGSTLGANGSSGDGTDSECSGRKVEVMERSRNALPQPFLIGVLDRDAAPGTQGWVFSSEEIGFGEQTAQQCVREEHSGKDDLSTSQVLALFARFAVERPSSTPAQLSANGRSDDDIVTIGSMHGCIRRVLSSHSSGILREDLFGKGGPFTKFLISLESFSGGNEDVLPPNMQYTSVRPGDYAVVMQHNQYIRHPRNLDGMASSAIRLTDVAGDNKEQLVAFAFLGHDGSVRTLWVDPKFRGQNLGTKLVRQMLRTQYDMFQQSMRMPNTIGEGQLDGKACVDEATVKLENKQWMVCNQGPAHTDISPENKASVRVFEKLGAVPAWPVYWARIDLGRAKAAVTPD